MFKDIFYGAMTTPLYINAIILSIDVIVLNQDLKKF